MSYPNKRIAVCAIAALFLQGALAPLAVADVFATPLDTEPRLMLYVSKAFGEQREFYKAPQLGLRFERTVEFDPDGFRLDRYAPSYSTQTFADFRWTSGFGESVRLFGVPVHRSQLQLNSGDLGSADSGSGESSAGYGNFVLYTVIGAAALCIFETWICESDSSDYRPGELEPATGR